LKQIRGTIVSRGVFLIFSSLTFTTLFFPAVLILYFICTDLFGGSVNNEFTKIVQTRPRTYLVTNMNLPLLIQLLFSDESAPVEETIRAIVAADDTRVKFVNDLLVDDEEEEEF